MKPRTNARIAGTAFLLYIVAGIGSMVLFGRISGGAGIGDRLSAISLHPAGAGVVILLGFVQTFCAITLGVTLFGITRVEDPDLATFGLVSRVAEGIIGATIPSTNALLWLGSLGTAAVPNPTSANAIAALLLRVEGWQNLVSATFFAVGSTFFAVLFLRGRLIPAPLAWLGVIASVILSIALPFQLAGFLQGTVTMIIWAPMLLFEVPLAFWLLVKGVASPVKA